MLYLFTRMCSLCYLLLKTHCILLRSWFHDSQEISSSSPSLTTSKMHVKPPAAVHQVPRDCVFYIVGQRDQLTYSSPQWMLLSSDRKETLWWRGWGLVDVSSACGSVSPSCLFSLIPDASCCLSKLWSRSATVSGSRQQSWHPYWEVAARGFHSH